ncbi:MAG: hypothetical protein ACKPKO_27750, partial [Candidatus Fonsibacter sp.]
PHNATVEFSVPYNKVPHIDFSDPRSDHESNTNFFIRKQIDATERIPYIFLAVKKCEAPTNPPCNPGPFYNRFDPLHPLYNHCPPQPVPPCDFEASIRSEEEIQSQENFIPLLVKLLDEKDEIPQLLYYLNDGSKKSDD